MTTKFCILSSVTLSPPFKSCKRNKQLSAHIFHSTTLALHLRIATAHVLAAMTLFCPLNFYSTPISAYVYIPLRMCKRASICLVSFYMMTDAAYQDTTLVLKLLKMTWNWIKVEQ